MSTEIRDEIAAAASTVDDVECAPFYQQVTGRGEASVRYGSTAYPNKFGGITTWEVVVQLSQDVAQAEQFIEVILGPLVDALGAAMTVRRAYPANAVFGGAQTNVLVVEGTREDD